MSKTTNWHGFTMNEVIIQNSNSHQNFFLGEG